MDHQFYIGLFRGRSILSRAIRIFTRGPYSHAAWIRPGGSVLEAWRKGVTLSSLSAHHTAGTIVDLFTIPCADSATLLNIDADLLAERGKRYDYLGVLRFISKRTERDWARSWFCSEIIFAKFRDRGVHLLERAEPYVVSPTILSYSPLLKPAGTIRTGECNSERIA